MRIGNRSDGTNPRALGTNPRSLRDNRLVNACVLCGGKKIYKVGWIGYCSDHKEEAKIALKVYTRKIQIMNRKRRGGR